ncbi:MAG: helix-turn-helix domain-containing protein [Cyclobacteriaceae bacterium]|nr:helix-turn-helix transcriptional regulator [Cyclobacteriaceae bacterium]MCH8516064.1 helix-turn-helix domain-containing protein [Cyclobacteriaceae bacterium]
MIKEDSIRLIFGLKLKQLRLAKKINFQDLSKASGISVSYLNEIEKGKKYPKAEKIAALAEYFQVDYDKLVSLQLEAELKPIGELIHSNLLHELPLEIFGLDPASLLELLSAAPAKVGAFISTLIQITRNFDMNVGQFYLATLKSYQEMYDNYFPDIEADVVRFREKYIKGNLGPYSPQLLAGILRNIYHYEIDEEAIADEPDLNSLRSYVKIVEGKKKLFINRKLTERQLNFIFAREIAFNFMDLQNRPTTSTWVEIRSFEEVLNNFKASYFASALMIHEESLVEDAKAFFEATSFDPQTLKKWVDKYNVTTEMLLQRLTNVLPKHLGMKELFFLRFERPQSKERFRLTKELHLGGQQSPHGNELQQHYCRKWISLKLINQAVAIEDDLQILSAGQLSTYYQGDKSYLLLTLAPPKNQLTGSYSSISIGILLDRSTKKHIQFLKDSRIPKEKVGVTCEACPANDCPVRQVPAIKIELEQQQIKVRQALSKLK